MNGSETRTVLVALLFLTAGCLGGFAGASAIMDDGAALDGAGSDARQVEVAATGTAEAEPDRVYVRVTVRETAETAARARRQLARNVSELRSALDSADVTAENVTTVRYDIRYDSEPDVGADGPSRAVHEFLVTVGDVDRAGRVVDVAAIRGDGETDGIRFGFSRDRYRTLKQRALQDAMTAAREQATATAETEGLRLTGVHRVQTGGVVSPDRFDGGSFTTSGGGAQPPTDLAGGPRSVQVRVVISYNATG